MTSCGRLSDGLGILGYSKSPLLVGSSIMQARIGYHGGVVWGWWKYNIGNGTSTWQHVWVADKPVKSIQHPQEAYHNKSLANPFWKRP